MPDYEKIAASVEIGGAPAEAGFEPEVEIAPEAAAAAQRTHYRVSDPRYQGLAAEKGYDQSYSRIQRTHYSHEAMIDALIANPTMRQNDLAKMFDRSVPWISRILGSDAFQAAMAKRREELTDPFLIATIEERFRGLAYQSLDIITEKLEATKNVDLAMKALDVSAKVLGFGARGSGPTQNNQFVIQLPPKSVNSTSWAADHGPKQLEA